MHDRLRTLAPEKKRKWPEYLPELVYAYNSTPHSSTGYSPYFLFFGRDPVLPIDYMLQAVDQETGSGCIEEWITEHQERLDTAFKFAAEKTEKEAQRRRERNDAKADDTTLLVGATVFLKNRVQGRNKIQDVWNAEPYKVVKRLDTGNTYVVESLDDKHNKKTVYRKDILHANHLANDADFQILPQKIHGTEKDEELKDDAEDEPDNQDDDGSRELISEVPEFQDAPQKIHGNKTDEEPSTKASDTPDSNELESKNPEDHQQTSDGISDEPQVRRSTRQGKGQHSNPHRLPMSTLSGENTATVMMSPNEILNSIAQSNLLIVQMLSKNSQV